MEDKTDARRKDEELELFVKLFTDAVNAIALKWTEAEEVQEILTMFPDAEEWIDTINKLDQGQQLAGIIVLVQLSMNIDVLQYYFDREGIKAPSLFDFTRRKKQEDGSIKRDIDIFEDRLPEILDEIKATGKISPAVHVTKRGIMEDRVVKELLAGTMTPKKTKDKNGDTRYMVALNQAPKKSKKKVPIYFGLTAPDGEQVKTTRYMDGEDMDIFETVGTICISEWLQGEQFPIQTTAAEIWRTRRGISDASITPSQAQQENILKRLDKMFFTGLIMDVTKEAEEHFIDQLKDDRVVNGFIKTYFLEGSYGKVRTEKNRLFDGIKIEKLPFLYAYNLAKGHILLIDADLFDTSDTTDGMEDIEPLRRYLVSQIELMYIKRNGKTIRNNTIIRYDTIYKDGGIKTPEERIAAEGRTYKNDASKNKAIRSMAKRDRDHIQAILESWKKRQYILDYEQVKDSGKYTGVNIKLNPKNYKNSESGLANWTNKKGQTLKDII